MSTTSNSNQNHSKSSIYDSNTIDNDSNGTHDSRVVRTVRSLKKQRPDSSNPTSNSKSKVFNYPTNENNHYLNENQSNTYEPETSPIKQPSIGATLKDNSNIVKH